MTEISRPWDGTSTGDATLAPYDAQNEWAEIWMAMMNMGRIANRGGVCWKELNSYAITAAAGSVNVDTGRAFVYGTEHQNTAIVNIAIPTPVIGDREDRIVLRKDWTAQTVRIYRHAGSDGGGTPENLEQTAGVAWEIPLGVVKITTAGVITVLPEGIAGGGVSYPGRLWYPIPNLSTPFVSLRRTSTLTVPTGAAYTNLAWDTVIDEDIDNMWDVGTPERITITTPGVYLITMHARFNPNAFIAAAEVSTRLRVNGGSNVPVHSHYCANSSAVFTPTLQRMYKFNAGDYFDVGFLHAGGGNGVVSADLNAPYQPTLQCRWMSPLGVS